MKILSRLSVLVFILLFVMGIFVGCVDSDNFDTKDKGSQQDDGKQDDGKQDDGKKDDGKKDDGKKDDGKKDDGKKDDGKKDDDKLCKGNGAVCNDAILSYCKVGQKEVVKDCKFYEMCDLLNQRCLEKCPNRRMKRCISNVVVDCSASGELKLRDCTKRGKVCVASHGNAKCVGKDGKEDDNKDKDDVKKKGDDLCIYNEKRCINGVLIMCRKGERAVEKDCLIQEMCDIVNERCLEKCPNRGKLECRDGMIVECSESGVLKVKDCVAENKGCVELDGIPQCSDG